MGVTSREDFRRQVRAFWVTAIEAVGGSTPPTTATWTGLESICNTLHPFMGSNRNHAHLPTGGGMDISKVQPSVTEAGCIELVVDGGATYMARPSALTFEHFPAAPINTFLLLELADLQPSGVYGEHHRPSEELVELTPGQYVERGVWDDGYYGHDERGREIPLPDDSRLIVRWFSGKILFVAKGSLWNGTPATYRGQHNNMTSTQIRQAIEHCLAQQSE
jgi:hypothetical protein